MAGMRRVFRISRGFVAATMEVSEIPKATRSHGVPEADEGVLLPARFGIFLPLVASWVVTVWGRGY
ncbi:MAG: hypothetical protein ACYC9S_13245 [Leptospirales bacterium]